MKPDSIGEVLSCACRPPRLKARRRLDLLYAPLTIPLVYCHINDFQRASRLARPFQGGEKMTAVWASHHEELCSAGVVAPHVHTHMVAPHCWGVLDGGNPLGSAVDASRRPSMGRPLPH